MPNLLLSLPDEVSGEGAWPKAVEGLTTFYIHDMSIGCRRGSEGREAAWIQANSPTYLPFNLAVYDSVCQPKRIRSLNDRGHVGGDAEVPTDPSCQLASEESSGLTGLLPHGVNKRSGGFIFEPVKRQLNIIGVLVSRYTGFVVVVVRAASLSLRYVPRFLGVRVWWHLMRCPGVPCSGVYVVVDWVSRRPSVSEALLSGEPGVEQRHMVPPGIVENGGQRDHLVTLDLVAGYQHVWQERRKEVIARLRHGFWNKLGALLHALPVRHLLIMGFDVNSGIKPLPGLIGRGVLQTERHADPDFEALLQAHHITLLNSWGSAAPSKSHTFRNQQVRTQLDFIMTRRLTADPEARRACPVHLDLMPWRRGPKHRPVVASLLWVAGWTRAKPAHPGGCSMRQLRCAAASEGAEAEQVRIRTPDGKLLDQKQEFQAIYEGFQQAAEVPSELRIAVLAIHESCKYKVKHGNFRDSFDMQVGVRQGRALSPLLYALYTAWLYDRIAEATSPQWAAAFMTIFADDKHLSWEVQDIADLTFVCKCVQVTFDLLKQNGMQVPLRIMQVSQIVYLGVVASDTGFEMQTFMHRQKAAAQNRQRLLKLLHSGVLSLTQRVRLYRACVVSSLLYGLHAVGLTLPVLRVLDATDARALRAIAKSRPISIMSQKLRTRLSVPSPADMLTKLLRKRCLALHSDTERRWFQMQLDQLTGVSSQEMPSQEVFLTRAGVPGVPCTVCGVVCINRQHMLSHMARKHTEEYARMACPVLHGKEPPMTSADAVLADPGSSSMAAPMETEERQRAVVAQQELLALGITSQASASVQADDWWKEAKDWSQDKGQSQKWRRPSSKGTGRQPGQWSSKRKSPEEETATSGTVDHQTQVLLQMMTRMTLRHDQELCRLRQDTSFIMFSDVGDHGCLQKLRETAENWQEQFVQGRVSLKVIMMLALPKLLQKPWTRKEVVAKQQPLKHQEVLALLDQLNQAVPQPGVLTGFKNTKSMKTAQAGLRPPAAAAVHAGLQKLSGCSCMKLVASRLRPDRGQRPQLAKQLEAAFQATAYCDWTARRHQ
ncbi:unnamed protein product [Symbiodinium sp. CCMP2592]|nr:unnamed protein product [Symbiodinium sp. CCMP2592]